MEEPIIKHLAEIVIETIGYNIREKSQKPKYFEARWIFYKLAFEYTNVSLAAAGREMGVSHATVINAMSRVHNPNYFTEKHEDIYLKCKEVFSKRYVDYTVKTPVSYVGTKITVGLVTSLKVAERKLNTTIQRLETRVYKIQSKLSIEVRKLKRRDSQILKLKEDRDMWKMKYLNK